MHRYEKQEEEKKDVSSLIRQITQKIVNSMNKMFMTSIYF